MLLEKLVFEGIDGSKYLLINEKEKVTEKFIRAECTGEENITN